MTKISEIRIEKPEPIFDIKAFCSIDQSEDPFN